MPHFSLWTDMAVMFAVVIVAILLVVIHNNINRRPRPARRKVPERIDLRLAEILEQGRESPAEMPVQDALRQASADGEPAEGQGAKQESESSPEVDCVLEEEDAPREAEMVVFPGVAEAGSSRLFRRDEEEREASELGGESRELRERLKDHYSMYLREKQG